MTEIEQKRSCDPLLLNISNNGHKVVAYPNAQQRLLQHSSSMNTTSSLVAEESGIQLPALKPVSTRSRSLSAGRVRRSGIDLIQDIYDRLGVSRGKLVDGSTDSISDQHPNQQPKQLPQTRFSMSAIERGRSRDTTTAEDKDTAALHHNRSRSWSRGSLHSRWPPASAAAVASDSSKKTPTTPKLSGQTFRSISNYEEGAGLSSSKLRPGFRSGTEATPVVLLAPKPRTAVLRSSNISTEKATSTLCLLPKPMQAAVRCADETAATSQYMTTTTTLKSRTFSRFAPTNSGTNDDSNSSTERRREERKKEMGFPSSNSKLVVECRDEKKDGGSKADEGNDEVRTNVPCVKDLLRAFSGPEENKNAGGGAGASKRVDQEQSPRWREYPPQIDMYAAEKNLAVYVSEEKKEDDHSCVGSWKQPHTPKSSIPQPLTTNTEKPGARRTSPSSLGAVLSPLPPASFGNNNNTNRSSPNSVGSAFLVAIQTTVPPEKQQQSQLGSARSHHHFAPFTEISSEEQGSVTESVSVSILSSVGSDDQLSPASTNRLIANQANNHSFKKPSWLERRKRSSVNTTTSSKANGTALVTPAPLSVPLRVAAGTTTTTTATCASSVHSEQTQSAILEKMVDERVRARVAELERRMEEQMHAFMQEMDAKVTFQMARLKERDSSTDGYPPNAHTHTEIDQSIDLP